MKKMQQRDEAQTSDQLVKSEIKHDCVTPPLVILHAFQGLAQTSSTGGACFHSHLHDMIWLQKHQKKKRSQVSILWRETANIEQKTRRHIQIHKANLDSISRRIGRCKAAAATRKQQHSRKQANADATTQEDAKKPQSESAKLTTHSAQASKE